MIKSSKKFIPFVLAALFLLTACKKDPVEPAVNTASTPPEVAASPTKTDPIIDPPEASDTYRLYYSGELTTLNYLIEGSTNNAQASSNLVDTLVEYNIYGIVQPALAESWETSEDGLEWTFHIKKGLVWVDNKGAEVGPVTADDWVAAAEHSLNPANSGGGVSYMMKDYIVNATEFANGDITDFTEVGVKALDESTLVYTIMAPTPYFLSLLGYGSFIPGYAPLLREKGLGYGLDKESIVFNGPFYLEEWKPQEVQIFRRNPSYWDAEHVYLETIHKTYNSEANSIAPEAFLRGEIDYASINSELIDEYMSDPVKNQWLQGQRQNNSYTYFYGFNFNPNFDEVHDPDNWRIAVNNTNFRKSIFHALNRKAALSAMEPFDPESLMNNTLTPAHFSNVNGKEYTEFAPLAPYTKNGSEDVAKALEFKEKAIEELTAKGATFPIKVLVKYNPNSTNWEQECVLVEQLLETALGDDYIDVVLEAGPSEGFLDAVRRSGNFGFMKLNWGADYDDPQTFINPFGEGNSYMFIDKSGNPDTEAFYQTYLDALHVATSMTMDPNYSPEARFEAFATAEAILLDHAVAIPYSVNQVSKILSKLDAFEGGWAAFGNTTLSYKHMRIQTEPINLEVWRANYDQWLKNKDEAHAALTK